MATLSATKNRLPVMERRQDKADNYLDNEKIIEVNLRPEMFIKEHYEVTLFSGQLALYTQDAFAWDYQQVDNQFSTADFHREFIFPYYPEWAILMTNVFAEFYQVVLPINSWNGYVYDLAGDGEFRYQWEKVGTDAYKLYIYFGTTYVYYASRPMLCTLKLHLYNDRVFREL